MDSDPHVYQYSTPSAWTLLGATDTTKKLDTTSQTGGYVYGFCFSTDGTNLYVQSYDANRTIFQYTLGTAWDVSTATYSGKSFQASGQAACEPKISSDGKRMYWIDQMGDDSVRQYNLTTAYDVSTATLAARFYIPTTIDATPRACFVGDGGTKLYVVGLATDYVYQFALDTWQDVTTTSGVVKATDSTNLTHAGNTTQQITSGTFVTPNSGVSETGEAGSNGDLDFSPNTKCEVEYAIEFISADVQEGDSIPFQVKNVNTRTEV
jgi:hypothetical protein